MPPLSRSMDKDGLGLSLRSCLLTGLLTGFAGLLFCLAPVGGKLEESLGLEWLFHWRGPRAAPAEVVVVALDENASMRLGLPADPAEWPRRWHAKLIDRLSEAGVRFIAFDLFFHRASEPKDDHALAAAMHKAGNVGLVDFFTTHVIDPNGSPGEGAIEMRSPPQPIFAEASKVIAPFLLPKQPARVSRYLSFLPTRSGTIATLPTNFRPRHSPVAPSITSPTRYLRAIDRPQVRPFNATYFTMRKVHFS